MDNSSYLQLQKDLAKVNTSDRELFQITQQVESVFEKFRKEQLSFVSKAAKSFDVSDLVVTTRSLAASFQAAQVDMTHVKEFTQIGQIMQEALTPIQNMANEIQKSTKFSFGKASHIAGIAESIRAQSDLSKLYNKFNVDKKVVRGFGEFVTNTEHSFAQLAKFLAETPQPAEAPLVLLPSAAREILVSEYAIAELSIDESKAEEAPYAQSVNDIREEVDHVEGLIENVNPELAITHRGAREAFQNKNADYKRHILISLREMWNNLLWSLAPNDKVIPWIGGDLQYLHKGKPTRKARIDYVCRDYNCKPLSTFLDHDTKAFIAMIAIFNRVHNLDNGLTDLQLEVLLLRSDSWLMFILGISEKSN